VSELRTRAVYGLIVATIVIFDQITKWLVDRSMKLHESIEIVSGLVSLTYVRNRGAAFGILSDADLPYQSGLFVAVSVAALVAIAVYALRLPPASRLPQTALALVMGGAIGNLIDRALFGYVIDFVDVYWRQHHWPAFNVADSAISVGVCLLVLDILRSPAEARKPEMAGAAPSGQSE
jgi:signal peptidase II